MLQEYNGLLHVNYGQAYVFGSCDNDSFDMDRCFRGQVNGLCGARLSGALFLMTGVHTGVVGLTVDVFNDEPPQDEIWEDVVEVSFNPGTKNVILMDWDGNVVCKIPLQTETYRVRYCSRNIDLGHEDDSCDESKPVEFHSLLFWPASFESDIIIKQHSKFAEYSHNYAESL